MNEWIDNFLRFEELMQAARILIAIFLGACIGFEREKYGRPAGLRTHMIVTVASTLAMIVSIYGFESGDPARLAAQVISGIGFIGAGTIIRGDKDITGITTAATIWICAIIGLACGAGNYFGAFITTISVLVILSCLTRFESKISKGRKNNSNLFLVIKNEEDTMEKFRNFLNECDLSFSYIEYKRIENNEDKNLKVNIGFARLTRVEEINNFIAAIDKEFETLQCKITNETYVKMK